jgi:hypothetical protein
MSIEINWTWGPLRIEDRDGRKGVIVGVDWRCMAVDTDTSIHSIASGVFLPPEIDELAPFIELDGITKESIQEWIDKRFHASTIEAECRAAVENQIRPKVFSREFPA